MKVCFRTKKLEKCYLEAKQATKEFGADVAPRYVMRINIMKSARDLEALKRQRTLRCHQLKGTRKGQWAISLTNRFRLIFSLVGHELEIVRIEEVSNHYGD